MEQWNILVDSSTFLYVGVILNTWGSACVYRQHCCPFPIALLTSRHPRPEENTTLRSSVFCSGAGRVASLLVITKDALPLSVHFKVSEHSTGNAGKVRVWCVSRRHNRVERADCVVERLGAHLSHCPFCYLLGCPARLCLGLTFVICECGRQAVIGSAWQCWEGKMWCMSVSLGEVRYFCCRSCIAADQALANSLAIRHNSRLVATLESIQSDIGA